MLIVALLVSGCASTQMSTVLTDDDQMQIEIYSRLMMPLIYKEVLPERRYYLAVNSTTNEFSSSGLKCKWRAPSPRVVAHLMRVGYDVRKYSSGPKVYGNGKDWMMWVTKQKVLSPTEVQFEAGMYGGYLAGGAFHVVLVKTDGKWKIDLNRFYMKWIS